MIAIDDSNKREFFLSRELSWLEFNHRVLEEAIDPSQPLLERVRFLCITSSNLDEFFEVRVAGIKQQIENGGDQEYDDGGMSPYALFDAIQKRAHRLVKEQYDLWNQEIVPQLKDQGIHFHDVDDLSSEDVAWAEKHFSNEIYPVLTPLAVDSSHPFPQLLNKSHNLIVTLKRHHSGDEISYAIVQIPRVLPRLVKLPRSSNETGWHFIILERLIRKFISQLFPGDEILEVDGFRITRNSDLYIDEEEADNLLKHIEEGLRKRNRGKVVRLEIEQEHAAPVRRLLMETFEIGEEDVYEHDGPINFLHIMPLCFHEAFPHLRDRPWTPLVSPVVPTGCDLFDIMRKQDVLLHHPYDSFSTVVDFVEAAAEDKQVLAIKMTLYRTSGDSPIVRALIRAAQNGKQVTTLVELKARFDEMNNITWARQLEEAGVHVVYGVVGLKTHCKIMMVVRRDEDRIRHYAHLGTGNYHPSTARFYTDLSLLTTREELTKEMATLFNILTGLRRYEGINQLLVAPFEMASKFKKMIERETALAKEGKPGRIIAKMNSLVDEELIEAMYEAASVGVQIDLIIRGICCLRPGIKGVSENIRVTSIVGRFLEHSRLFYFGNNGDPQIYLGSADWMPRNLYKRVEVIFPILDPALKKRLIEEIIATFLADNTKARLLQNDGTYVRRKPAEGEKPSASQLTFRELARQQQQNREISNEEPLRMLTPASKPAN